MCNTLLVTLRDQYSATPVFHLFTDVPVPGRFYGLVTDDLTLSVNSKETFYGEKLGIPRLPIGLYDFTGRLVDTICAPTRTASSRTCSPRSAHTTARCPPARARTSTGSSRTIPVRLSTRTPTTNPNYRTIATNFQLWPNLTLPADLAPVPIAQLVEGPGTPTLHPADCTLPGATPKLLAVSRPYQVNNASAAARTITITGRDLARRGRTARCSSTASPSPQHRRRRPGQSSRGLTRRSSPGCPSASPPRPASRTAGPHQLEDPDVCRQRDSRRFDLSHHRDRHERLQPHDQ